MKKLNMQTSDLTKGNIAKIAELFPIVITEREGKDGVVDKAVDFDLLRQALQGDLVEGDDERYRLDWPGKRASLLKANTPIQKTLRPDRESSVNFDTTQNLFIEGDNFEVLKMLQESYLGKVKMIYIDPPYNTGNDFVYKDNFAESKGEYEEELGVEDEEGGRLFRNTDTNGRFHSDWLSMIYERLTIARDLLNDEGVLFISIDDHEAHNLRKICDEIFGEANFVANIIWQSRTSISNDQEVSLNHNHSLIYSKKREALKFYGEPLDAGEYSNPDNDKRGPWKLVPLDANKPGGDTQYPILNPTTKEEHYPPNGRSWAINRSDFQKLLQDGRILFGKKGDTSPKKKLYIYERLQKEDTKTPSSVLLDAGTTKSGTEEVMELFDGKKVFDYPKPTTLIKRFLNYGCGSSESQIVLDFFAGSSSTADAVLQLNAENSMNHKFIMVQLPEDLEKGVKAAKGLALLTLTNAIELLRMINKSALLTELGKERIRRAGKKILEENKEVLKERKTPLDIGFRVFKADTTNMKDVYYNPSELKQESLLGHVDNVKDDRTPEDLLTQVILDLGLELSLPIEQKKIKSNTVHFVQGNALVACFDEAIDFAIVDEIAKLEPLKVVFRDSCFKEEQDRTNVETRFKRLSPDTVITVL